MSNNLQINVSISSINTEPIYWCLGAVMNHVSSQLQAITKGKPFSANTFCEQLHSMSNPSQLCGTAQVRCSIHVFAYLGLQTEEYQASEEIQIHTVTQKVEDRQTDESTLWCFRGL